MHDRPQSSFVITRFGFAAIGASLIMLSVSGCGEHLMAADDGLDCDHGDEDSASVSAERPWLLAIDEDEGKTDALVKIRVDPGHEGERIVICEDLTLPPDFPADTNFTSLAVDGNRIVASGLRETWGDTLLEIDPCTCEAREIGSFGFTLVSGLAFARDGALFGVAAEGDLLVSIEAATANAQMLAQLSDDWGSNALSMSADGTLLYGLDASGDRLHTLRVSDGASVGSMLLGTPFQAAGLELHAEQGRLYACGVEGEDRSLFEIDPLSGAVTRIASEVFTTRCDNLAAPSSAIVCIPD